MIVVWLECSSVSPLNYATKLNNTWKNGGEENVAKDMAAVFCVVNMRKGPGRGLTVETEGEEKLFVFHDFID